MPGRERQASNDFTHLRTIRTQEKLKEQNSSRITELKNGLTGTKGKGSGEDGWVGRDNGEEGEGGGRKKGGIKISMHGCVGERGGLYNTEKTSSDSATFCYAD